MYHIYTFGEFAQYLDCYEFEGSLPAAIVEAKAKLRDMAVYKTEVRSFLGDGTTTEVTERVLTR